MFSWDRCPNGECTTEATACSGKIDLDSNEGITPQSIKLTGSSRTHPVVLRIDQGVATIGIVTISPATFPVGWTMEIRPSPVRNQNDEGCDGKKQNLISSPFDLIVRDHKGRTRQVNNLSKPLNISLFGLLKERDQKVGIRSVLF